MNFGLYFGSDNPLDYDAKDLAIMISQKFIALFKETIGHKHCAKIIETWTIGYALNPGESEESMMTFAKEKGFEKCGLAPGLAAGLAAGLIIDSMK